MRRWCSKWSCSPYDEPDPAARPRSPGAARRRPAAHARLLLRRARLQRRARAGASLIDLIPVDGKLGRAGGAAPGQEGRNLDHFCLAIAPPWDADAIIAY